MVIVGLALQTLCKNSQELEINLKFFPYVLP